MVGADEEDFLNGARCIVETFETGVGEVLNFESAGIPLTHFDPTRHDPTHLLAPFQDAVADLIEPQEPSVLSLHPSEFHSWSLYIAKTGHPSRWEFASRSPNITDTMFMLRILLLSLALSTLCLGQPLKIEFERKSDWAQAFVGEVVVRNLSSNQISDWRVRLKTSAQFQNIWNAQTLSQEASGIYLFGPMDYNRTIPAGGEIRFGFQASPGGANIEILSNSVAESSSPPTLRASGLRTKGSLLIDSQGRAVTLQGVNWFGLETEDFAPHGLWARSMDDMLDQIAALGFNCLRVPFSNELLRPESQPKSINFSLNPDLRDLNGQQLLDALVRKAAKRNLWVVLDRHRPTVQGQSELWYTEEISETRWISDWVQLARRYSQQPNVIGADLHNEPHGSATWGSGDQKTDWRLAAERCGNQILEVNPNWLIIVEGVEKVGEKSYWWGSNLASAGHAPVRLKVPGRLVYSVHEYPESVYPQSWLQGPDFPANLPRIWEEHWGYLITQDIAPVFLGEFGSHYRSARDKVWMQSLIHQIARRKLSFTYWSWNPNSHDTGGLLQNDWSALEATKIELLRPLLRSR